MTHLDYTTPARRLNLDGSGRRRRLLYAQRMPKAFADGMGTLMHLVNMYMRAWKPFMRSFGRYCVKAKCNSSNGRNTRRALSFAHASKTPLLHFNDYDSFGAHRLRWNDHSCHFS